MASARVYADAVEFIGSGKSSLTELVDLLSAESTLEEAADESGYGPVDTLIDILEESGEFRVGSGTAENSVSRRQE